jgi:NAD(P)H-dependent FMN reductase
MPTPPKILALAGSLRADSFNKKLVRIAAAGARAAGAEVTVIDLNDYPLPIFNEDLEKRDGLPAEARQLKDLMTSHQGLLISSPEYNSSVTAALKNFIDWTSRSLPGEAALSSYVDKVAGLVSASPGALGGLRGLVHLRSILGNIHVLVLPDQLAVPRAHEAFLPDGSLKDPKQQTAAQAVGAKLASVIAKLRS